jgi:hypothetical protein
MRAWNKNPRNATAAPQAARTKRERRTGEVGEPASVSQSCTIGRP